MKNDPIYKYPSDYATENRQLEEYRTSRKQNIACSEPLL